MITETKFRSTKRIELGSCAFRQWRVGITQEGGNKNKSSSHVHGYRLMAKIYFECKDLDANGFVVDYGSLKKLRDMLEETFDHTLAVAGDDPLLETFETLRDLGGCDLRVFANGVGIERFAEFTFHTADQFIKKASHHRCWVSKVELWENEKNSAIFEVVSIRPSI